MRRNLDQAISYFEEWSDSRFEEVEAAVDEMVTESIRELELYRERVKQRLSSLSSSLDKPTETLINKMKSLQDSVDRTVTARENWMDHAVTKVENALKRESGSRPPEPQVAVQTAKEKDIKLYQAMSYTVFDTILFCITQGSSPDFTLISQSALFELVYENISRGYSSYLFEEVPLSSLAVIHQGRGILEQFREQEDRFLDEPDLWEVYAPQIQGWWRNTALPLVFGERDPDWDKATFPTHDEMMRWKEGEFSRMNYFPAVWDLVELAKERAVEVSDNFNFKPLLAI